MLICVKTLYFLCFYLFLRLLVYSIQLLSRKCVLPPEFQFALLPIPVGPIPDKTLQKPSEQHHSSKIKQVQSNVIL